MKVILPHFAKDHCFWNLWAPNCIDCIPFFCIDYFQRLFLTFQKTWLNIQLCSRSPVKSVLFICPSVCPSAYLWCLFLRIYSGFLKFFAWEYFAIYTKNWQRDSLENCGFCLDNWVQILTRQIWTQSGIFGILMRATLLFVL